MADPRRQIKPLGLTADAWAPFGWLPVADTDPEDGHHRLHFAWNDPHVNIIAHARAEVTEVPGALCCDELYRHDTHTQAIMSLDHLAVIAVAPSSVAFSSSEDAAEIAAFLLDPLQPFVLHRGTWHWGPFPQHAASVSLFNVQGLRYAEDNTRVDLVERGFAVDVLTL